MPMLAELVDAVVGIDTHRDTHQVEIALPTGAPIATCYDHQRHPRLRRAAGLDRRARPRPPAGRVDRGHPQLRRRAWPAPWAPPGWPSSSAEQPTPQDPPRPGQVRPDRRAPGRARSRCASTPTGCPPPAPTATAKPCASCSAPATTSPPTSTAQINRLRALLRDGDDSPTRRRLARGALTDATLTALARRRLPRDATRAQAVRHAEIRRLALALRDARRALQGQPRPTAGHRRRARPRADRPPRHRPGHRRPGHRVSFSHPGRCRNDAAFAALAGTSPLQASSGRTVRHRLNRGGDRALNRALHTIAMTRMRQLPQHPRLRRPPHRRGQDPPRDPPLPQALHRPRALPHPDHHHDQQLEA